DLDAIEIASYSFCSNLSLVDSTKKTWTKGMDRVKENFDDWMKSDPQHPQAQSSFLIHQSNQSSLYESKHLGN
ncbi:hypothetical protein P3S38_28890, partial [Enterobacter hormaechei]|uniref:hypothetical protein n=1 Tax=Enterobacter hormaechei TaxID=158836 RepID=UPI0023E38692